MGTSKIQNLIIMIDATRSLYRKDFRPNRLLVSLTAVKEFLEEYSAQKNNDACGVLVFGRETFILSPITQSKSTLLKEFIPKSLVKKITPQGKGLEFENALEQAIELLSDQIRLMGDQDYRILLITDTLYPPTNTHVTALIEKAKNLHIRLDVCAFNHETSLIQDKKYSALLKPTGGTLFHYNSQKKLMSGIKKLANTERESENAVGLNFSAERERDALIHEISEGLRIPSEKEKEDLGNRVSRSKCQICQQPENPLYKISLSKTGRYCPNCNSLFHLHCAAEWALVSEKSKHIFRCPYCLHLLKVPPALSKGIETKKKRKSEPNSPELLVKMVKFNPATHQTQENICLYCFTEADAGGKNTELYHCSYCKALYHLPCLKSMYKQKEKMCINCGGKIV